MMVTTEAAFRGNVRPRLCQARAFGVAQAPETPFNPAKSSFQSRSKTCPVA